MEAMSPIADPRTKGQRIRLLHTACIWWSFVGLGWTVALLGPAFPDLSLIIDKDLATSSWLFTSMSFGFLVGAIVTGIIYDRYNKLAVLTIDALGLALSTAALPWCSDFPLMLAMEFLMGLFSAGLDTGGTADILYMWEAEGSPYMQSVHFAFSLGAIIAPFAAKPFLAETTCVTDQATVLNISDTVTYSFQSLSVSNSSYTSDVQGSIFLNLSEYRNCTVEYAESKVQYAFLISACIIASSVVLYVVHWINHPDVYSYKVPKHPIENEKSGINEEDCDKSLIELYEANIADREVNALTHCTETDKSESGDFALSDLNDTSVDGNVKNSNETCRLSRPSSASSLSNQNLVYSEENDGDVELEHDAETEALTNVRDMKADINPMKSMAKGTETEHNNLNEEGHQRKEISLILKIVFVVLLSLLLSLYIILEKTFVGYFMTFSLNHLGWSKSDGANVTAVFWILFAFGRLTGIFIVKYVSETKLLFLHFCILLVSILGIWPASVYRVTFLIWVCTALSGFGMSIMFASVFSWMSQHVLNVSGKMVSLLMVSAAISSMAYPILLGHLMEVYTAMWFVYLLIIVACLSCLCFAVIYGLYRVYLCD